MWPGGLTATSVFGYQTAELELDATQANLPKEPDFVLTIC